VDKLRAMVVKSLDRNLYRSKYVNYIDAHIHKEYVKCKNFLKNNDDILVTKADKGQVTVIMDRSAYVDQMLRTLDDETTYRPVKNNPIRRITNRLDNLVKTWSDSKIIDEPTYRGLKVGSSLYVIAKFLHDIIKTSIKKPASHIKDSWSFASNINGKIMEPQEMMVSLDVTSLFTNIPKDLVMKGIENRWTEKY